MKITLDTPALLFPAVSLLLLAYTNRFMTVATLIRSLYAQWQDNHDNVLFGQITNLRRRVYLIRGMQSLGIGSLLLCVLSMFLYYLKLPGTGEAVFGISLVLLMLSLGLAIYEIQISVHALELQLEDLEKPRHARMGESHSRTASAALERDQDPPSVTRS